MRPNPANKLSWESNADATKGISNILVSNMIGQNEKIHATK